jgi:hypothetical protein
VIKDVSIERHLLKKSIKHLRLVSMAETINEHMYPTVKCPWGCTEFFTQCGSISIVSIFYRLLGSDLKCFAKEIREKNVKGIRDDFLDCHADQELFAWNPKWPVMPSIAFDEVNKRSATATFLTCRRHDGGCQEQHLHLPRSINNILPSRHGDQLAPAVIVPRVIKPARASKYSNTYQMNSLRGHYGGIDSISLSTHGKFDYSSRITSKNESTAIKGRDDVKALVHRWTESNLLIPPWLASSKIQQAELDIPDISIHENAWKGATFVTFKDAIKLQTMLKHDASATVLVPVSTNNSASNENLEPQYKAVLYSPVWPKWMTWLHTSNGFGATFPAIPRTSKQYDYRLLWLVTTMHSTIPEIWESCVQGVQRSNTDQYPGWLLLYLMRHCFPEKKRRTRSTKSSPQPFRVSAKCNKLVPHFERFIMSKLHGHASTNDQIEVNYEALQNEIINENVNYTADHNITAETF